MLISQAPLYCSLTAALQIAVIEFARNVLHMENANSTEVEPATEHPVRTEGPAGGATARAYQCALALAGCCGGQLGQAGSCLPLAVPSAALCALLSLTLLLC